MNLHIDIKIGVLYNYSGDILDEVLYEKDLEVESNDIDQIIDDISNDPQINEDIVSILEDEYTYDDEEDDEVSYSDLVDDYGCSNTLTITNIDTNEVLYDGDIEFDF